MQKGAVWWSRGRRTDRIRRRRTLQAGDELYLYYNPDVLSTEPTPCDLIADETDYSVWFKPYGVRSQGSKWGDHCTVYRWAEQHLKPERPTFIVHRLDRAATGLMLIAHKKKVATALSKLFEARAIEKRYRAIVHGSFQDDGSERLVDRPVDGKDALSRARQLDYDPGTDRSLVEVVIETGRKHQIRTHLSEIGYPIVGDRMYGRAADVEDLKLTACLLQFVCPVTGQPRRYEVPSERMPSLGRGDR